MTLDASEFAHIVTQAEEWLAFYERINRAPTNGENAVGWLARNLTSEGLRVDIVRGAESVTYRVGPLGRRMTIKAEWND